MVDWWGINDSAYANEDEVIEEDADADTDTE